MIAHQPTSERTSSNASQTDSPVENTRPPRRPESIKAILFDLDDTLLIDEAISQEALENTAQKARFLFGANPEQFCRDSLTQAAQLWKTSPVHPYCRRIGISSFECLWGNFHGETEALQALREWAQGFRVAVFDAVLRQQNIEASGSVQELADTFAHQRRRLQRLMADAKETLTRLKQKAKIALVTNGAPDLQGEKIKASGLESFFDTIAISGIHDIGKPHAELFHRVLAELGVNSSEAVMIGNSLERDIQGAQNAGICSIWIQVPGAEEPADVQPDFTIHSLAELPTLLDRITA